MRMLNKQKVVMNVSLVHFLFTIRLDNQINVYPYICTPPYLNNDIDYYDFRHRFNLSLEDSDITSFIYLPRVYLNLLK